MNKRKMLRVPFGSIEERIKTVEKQNRQVARDLDKLLEKMRKSGL